MKFSRSHTRNHSQTQYPSHLSWEKSACVQHDRPPIQFFQPRIRNQASPLLVALLLYGTSLTLTLVTANYSTHNLSLLVGTSLTHALGSGLLAWSTQQKIWKILTILHTIQTLAFMGLTYHFC